MFAAECASANQTTLLHQFEEPPTTDIIRVMVLHFNFFNAE